MSANEREHKPKWESSSADSTHKKKLGYDIYWFVMEFHGVVRSCTIFLLILKDISIRLV